MTYTPTDSIGKANLVMDLAAQRQRALGSNIANIDTPGYRRKDIEFGQYLGYMNSPLETELSTKLGPSAVIESVGAMDIDPAFELAEMQKNALVYTVATRRMSNIVTEMKTVINVGK